jgi:hypothetical protein
MQAANCCFSKLKPFRDADPLYPKELPRGGCRHDPFMSAVSRYFLVDKQIL